MKGLLATTTLSLLLCALLLQTTSGQITYGYKGCNRSLENRGWRPSHFKPWKQKAREINGNRPLTIRCGEAVKIAAGSNLNIRLPRGLRIDGMLKIDQNVKIRISTPWVVVRGKLRVGDDLRGMGNGNVEFILDNGSARVRSLTVPVGDLPRASGSSGEPRSDGKFGDRAFVVIGGTVDMYGLPRGGAEKVHSVLQRRASKGQRQIVVSGSRSWSKGAKIAIASTDYDYTHHDYATITKASVRSGVTTLTLDRPLRHTHYGKSDNFKSHGFDVNVAAEVILLTRKITIRSSSHGAGNVQGGHFMIAHTKMKQILRGVEFAGLGQQGKMGRYPVHFHMCGVTAQSEMKGCSIHKSFQRGIVIHGTRNVMVSDNVLFDVQGHGIMAGEDGWEENCTFIRNIGIFFNAPRRDKKLPDSTDHPGTAGMWISNPNHKFAGNRMSGSRASGIWVEVLRSVKGLSKGINGARSVVPQTNFSPLFYNNGAHSNQDFGLRLYVQLWLGKKLTIVDKLNVYKNGMGLHMQSIQNIRVTNSVFVDSRVSSMDNGGVNAVVQNSLVIGKSHLQGRCPTGSSFIFFPRRMNKLSPAWFDRLTITGFKSCQRGPQLVKIDGKSSQTVNEPWSTATGFFNCKFTDVSAQNVFTIAEAVNSRRVWSKYIGLTVRNSSFNGGMVPQGFVIPNTKFMRPASTNGCMNVPGPGLFCRGNNSCMRSIDIAISGNLNMRSNYRIRFTRKRNGAVEMPTPFKLSSANRMKFQVAVHTDEVYDVKLIIPRGARTPKFLEIMVGDADRPCKQGNILLDVVLDNIKVSAPHPYMGLAVPRAPTCRGPPRQKVTLYHDRCDRGTQKRRLTIQQGALHYWQDASLRMVRMDVSGGRARCQTSHRC